MGSFCHFARPGPNFPRGGVPTPPRRRDAVPWEGHRAKQRPKTRLPAGRQVPSTLSAWPYSGIGFVSQRRFLLANSWLGATGYRSPAAEPPRIGFVSQRRFLLANSWLRATGYRSPAAHPRRIGFVSQHRFSLGRYWLLATGCRFLAAAGRGFAMRIFRKKIVEPRPPRADNHRRGFR